VAAVNDRDKERSAFLDVDWSGRLAGPTRLEVLAVGVGGRYPGEPRIPEFRFAVEDARDLADVLADEGRPRFDRVVKPVVIADRTVPAEAMRQAFAHLRGRAWGAGDELIVVLEAHVLGCAAGHFVVGSDAGNGLPPRPAVAADEVADVLAGIAATGCRVLLLVDGVHEGRPSEWGRLDDWIRGLYRRNVITFVASNRGPSRVDVVQQRRVFTLGVLEGTAAGARVAPGRPSSLADLQAAVAGHVRALTGRTPQSAFCYIPEGISPGSPWLGP
jgi:hypothetical protein